MKKKLLSLLLVVALIFSLGIPALAEGEDAEITPYTVPEGMEGAVVILHSNDVHGAIEGYAKMATLKAMFEEAGAKVLVMDAGDFSQGTTYVSVSQGATAIELMNMVGYDVVAPGNHEFDYGYANLKELEKTAEFPILAANLTFEDGYALGSHVVLEAGGLKIGVFGLDTPETATKAHPAKIKGVGFAGSEEMYTVAQGQVDALKAEGVDVIVCLGHLGIDEESAANGNRSIDLLAKVTGIDVFVDGHSHSTEDQIVAVTNEDRTVGDTVVTSTGTKFANIGVIVIKDGAVASTECVDTARIDLDEESEIHLRAEAIKTEIEDLYGAAFAKSEVDLNGDKAPGNRTEETNLGDLITDAMLWLATKDELSVPSENVVAITNGGGIRASIKAGDVCRNDVNTVLPFGNTVAVAYVTGAVLEEVLEASTFCTPSAVGGFPQVAGINMSIDTAAEYQAGENYPGTTYAAPTAITRVTINSINGKELDREATYAVVTNDFVAAGGDTYYALSTSETITDTGVPLDEALMQYIESELKGVIPADKYGAPQGRIAVKYVGIEAGSWYTSFAKDVMDQGIMTGTGKGFDPTGLVTRATVFQTLYNMAGKPEVNNKMATFPDAQETWFEDAARWAEQAELTTGTDNGFEGNRLVTREEIVTILYRYAQYIGYDVSVGESTNILSYADAETVHSWAIPAFQWAVGDSIVGGKDGGRLAPTDTATRAELAKILSTTAASFFAEGRG